MGVLEAMIERQTGTHGTTTKIKGNRKHRLRQRREERAKNASHSSNESLRVEPTSPPAVPHHTQPLTRPARFARRASVVLAQHRNDYDLIAK